MDEQEMDFRGGSGGAFNRDRTEVLEKPICWNRMAAGSSPYRCEQETAKMAERS